MDAEASAPPAKTNKSSRADDCIPLSAFGRLVNSIPEKLAEIVPFLSERLNKPSWNQHIAVALVTVDKLTTEQKIAALAEEANIYDFTEMIQAFSWFFRGVKNCDRGKRFIERAKDEKDGK